MVFTCHWVPRSSPFLAGRVAQALGRHRQLPLRDAAERLFPPTGARRSFFFSMKVEILMQEPAPGLGTGPYHLGISPGPPGPRGRQKGKGALEQRQMLWAKGAHRARGGKQMPVFPVGDPV